MSSKQQLEDYIKRFKKDNATLSKINSELTSENSRLKQKNELYLMQKEYITGYAKSLEKMLAGYSLWQLFMKRLKTKKK